MRWINFFILRFQHTAARRRLLYCGREYVRCVCFNTQPPEGGCNMMLQLGMSDSVSTHSRPKAAARKQGKDWFVGAFQHTAARRRLLLLQYRQMTVQVSTHSRPKAAGWSA